MRAAEEGIELERKVSSLLKSRSFTGPLAMVSGGSRRRTSKNIDVLSVFIFLFANYCFDLTLVMLWFVLFDYNNLFKLLADIFLSVFALSFKRD